MSKIYLKLCVTELDFWKKKNILFQKWAGKNWIYWKIWSSFFLNLAYSKHFYYLIYFWQISCLEKICFLSYGSKCSWPSILPTIWINFITPMKWWNTSFFEYWIEFRKIKSCLKIFCADLVKNGCGPFGQQILKLAVSRTEELMDWINGFFADWYKLKEANSYFNNFCVGIVKNWCDLLGHWTLKPAVSQEWIDELSLFFVSW